MHRLKMWVEEHPYLTGALILGLVLVFILIRNRSKNASGGAPGVVTVGPSDALQAAALQAGVQIQTAQLQGQTQIAAYNASVNATQLQAAASVAQSQIQAGVTNYQTAGQVQLGLAQLGFTPSTSPFGLTMPISGVTPVLPGQSPGITPPVTNPSVPTQPPLNALPVTVVPSAPSQYATPSQIQNEFAGITPATVDPNGYGGPVNVPSVPIYGPMGVVLGNTSPTTIPSSSGLSWNQYYAPLVESRFNPSSVQPADVTAITAANIAAQNDYLYNPNSCHNRVCA